MRHILSASFFAAVFAFSAQAQDDTAPVDAPMAAASSIPMISGGVGAVELEHMTSIESQYNLKLMFAEKNGVYLANVAVQIADAKGAVIVDTVAKGPILLVTLPAGTYNVTATEAEKVEKQKIMLGKTLREYVLRFPTSVDSEVSK